VKRSLNAKVIGHRLFEPNARKQPGVYAMKCLLEVEAGSVNVDKPSGAILILEVDESGREFPVGRLLRMTFEDSQQELELGPPPAVGAEPNGPSGKRKSGTSRLH